MTLGGNKLYMDQENTCHRNQSQHRATPAAPHHHTSLNLYGGEFSHKKIKQQGPPDLSGACTGSNTGFTAQEDLPSCCTAIVPGCQAWVCGSCSLGCLLVPARSPARSA